MISLEKGLFDPNNHARKRITQYGSFLEQLDIIVLGTKPYNDDIAPNVHVTSTNSPSRWWYLFDALQLVWKTRTNAYDVVVTQDINEMGLIGYLAAKLHKAAFAPHDVGYFFHGDYFAKESLGNRLRTWLGHWLLTKIDAIRVMSTRSKEILIQNYAIPPEAIACFPFEVHSQFLAPAQPLPADEAAVLQGKPYFLIPARFVPIKRIDLALQAFAKIAARNPEPLLVLIGQGPLKEVLEKQITSLQLETRVLIQPWTQAMASWYRGALATVITSDREGYAMTALESLLCHAPVLMTDVGCARETVIDTKNGYVVPVGDVSAIAEAMEKIIANTDNVHQGAAIFTHAPSSEGTKFFIDLAIARKKARFSASH